MAWHFVGRKHKKAWRAAPLYIFWTIWKERNRRVFEEEEKLDQCLKSSFLSSLAIWIQVYIDGTPLSLMDIVDWLGSR